MADVAERRRRENQKKYLGGRADDDGVPLSERSSHELFLGELLLDNLVTSLLHSLDRPRRQTISHDDLHLLDVPALDLGVRVVNPLHQLLNVRRLNGWTAPDAKAGGSITVRPDVECNLIALEERGERLDLVLVQVLDD